MGKLYRNTGGTYQDLKGVNHPTGAVVESEDDLCAKFAQHFEEVHPVETYTTQPPATPAAPVVVEDGEDDGEEVLPEGHTDVTAKFPIAGKNDLLVTRDKAGWWVHDGDEIQNESVLKMKDVEAFIKEYLGEK